MYKWNASKDFPDKENCRETCFSKTVKTEPDMVCTQGLQVRGERHTPDSTYDLRFDVHDCGSTGGPGLNLDLSYTGPDGLRPLMGDVEPVEAPRSARLTSALNKIEVKCKPKFHPKQVMREKGMV